MEVKIKRGDRTELIELEEPLGKHQREWLLKLSEMEKEKSAEKINSFLNFRDDLIIELSKGKLKKKDLDEMPMSKKNEIIGVIEGKLQVFQESKKGFTNS